MGLECETRCEWQGKNSTGRAMLEGDHLLFRGEFRLKINFSGLSDLKTEDGRLYLTDGQGTACLHLGNRAADWERRIRNPKSLADKLGIKSGQSIRLLGGIGDPALLNEVSRIDAQVTEQVQADWYVLHADHPDHLAQIPQLRIEMPATAGLWVIHPKGKTSPVPQAAVMNAGRGAGLVDNKTCAVSEVSTGLKFVRPKAKT